MPCATVFILDPSSGGSYGQSLPPELELGPPPRDCRGPLCSHPSAGKSGHPVSAGPGGRGGKPCPSGSRARPARGGCTAHAYLAFHAIQRESWRRRGPGYRNNTKGEQERDTQWGGEELWDYAVCQACVLSPPPLQSSLQVCSQKGEECWGLEVSQGGTKGGWGDPEARSGCEGRGQTMLWKNAVPHTYQEVFSWKTGQELGSSLAAAGKEGEGATSREAGVWGASRRLFRAHPSRESRGSPRRVERSDLQRSGGGLCGVASLFTLVAAAADLLVLFSLSPPLPLSVLSPFCFPHPVPPSIVVIVPDPSHPLPCLCLSFPPSQSPPPSPLFSTLWFPSLQTASLLDKNSGGSSQARLGAR